MIGRIQGKILEKIPPHILVDCNGVGYEIEVPMTTFYDLPEVGSEVVSADTFSCQRRRTIIIWFRNRSRKDNL